MSRTALFVRWILGILAAVFLVLGLAFMFLPTTMIGAMDITAGSPKALADIRAVYGGLDLALGILLTICFLRKEWAVGLAIGTLVCACLFAGRLVGILLDGADDILTFGLIASEALGAILAAVAWFLARSPEPIAVSAAPPPAEPAEVALPAQPAEASDAASTSTTEPHA